MSTKPPVEWKNILNYQHLPLYKFYLDTFRTQAQNLGYPYFSWNDLIYDTTTGMVTQFVVVRGNHIRDASVLTPSLRPQLQADIDEFLTTQKEENNDCN